MYRSLTLTFFLLPILLLAQPKVEAPYEKAYNEISAMLDGKIDYSFKRAVFSSENAFFGNTLDYEAFQQQIEILSGIANYVAKNGTLEYDYSDRDKIAKYWGTFMTLKHPLSIPLDSGLVYETSPFKYDFEDYNGEKDWTKMFVTKALFTNSGNCHSLPFLYKIIVEELGEEAWLAMSPNHTYIKHRSLKNGMYNTELTTGHFPVDSWIMASGYIKLDAVVNAVYMDTLSQKESIAVTLVDLAQGYQKKYGEDHNQAFVLKCLDKALVYYPHYVNALILKAEIHKDQYEQQMDQHGVESPSDLWNDPVLKNQFDEIQAQYAHIHKLGYRKMPDDMYMNWLLDVEERDQEDKSARTTFEAPQPFEDYGYQVKTLTLSKGKYQEFFDQEETTEIGSIVFNRMTNSITHFVTYDTVRSEATLEPEIISRWMSPDPLAEEYYSHSPYSYVVNNPINAIDPDGRRVFFVAGAGNDADGWNYINRIGVAFTNAGIRGFTRINASGGQLRDMMFTSNYRHSGYETYGTGNINSAGYASGLAPTQEYDSREVVHDKIGVAISQIQENLKDNPLEEGEQFNLAGYSYGSVLQAQVALQLANDGQYIDNLILIGSPISDKSDLYKQLLENENIGNVIRYDIEGDRLSNPQDIADFLKGVYQNSPELLGGQGDKGPHFDLARPGQETDRLMQIVAEWLRQQGVK